MEAFALYLLKSVIWLTGFTIVYFLFLKNERFFRLKRYYLVAGILISFIFPLFTFIIRWKFLPRRYLYRKLLLPVPVQYLHQTSSDEKPFDLGSILLLVYLSGILFLA